MLSRQQFLRYEARQSTPAPVAPRPLTRSQRILTALLWVLLIPFLLLGFLVLGERPRLKA